MKHRRLLISLVPDLHSEMGHQYIYHKTMGEALQDLGFDHLALISKNPIFASLPKGWSSFFHKKNNAYFSIGQTAIRFYDFARVVIKKRSQESIFFLESFNTSDLVAFALAVFLCAKKTDTFWLLFRYGIHQLPFRGKIHKYLLKGLHLRLKKRLLLLTDSKLIQEEFDSPLRLVPVLPISHHELYLHKKKPSLPIICWWPGEPRVAKGLKAIQRLVATQESLASTFLLRCSEKTALPKRGLLPIERVSECLSREEYRHYFLESDVILLPYDPVTYKLSTSGIFVEAVACGKIPLVMKGSWLSYELEKAELSALIVDWENPCFFSHLDALMHSREIHSKLARMRAHYQSIHSPSMFIKAFL